MLGRGNCFVPCIVSMSVYDMYNINMLLVLYIGHTSNNVQISIVECKFDSLPGSLPFCR